MNEAVSAGSAAIRDTIAPTVASVLAVPARCSEVRRRIATPAPSTSPSAKTRVGSRAPCQIEGRANSCSEVSTMARESVPNVPNATAQPSRKCGVSAIRRPARYASNSVSSANPSGAMVSTNGADASGNPTLVAVSSSRVSRTSTPCPSIQVSAAARQKTIQSTCSPYWNAHITLSGTSVIPTPIPTTSRASSAAKTTVSGRFIPVRHYRRRRRVVFRTAGRPLSCRRTEDFRSIRENPSFFRHGCRKRSLNCGGERARREGRMLGGVNDGWPDLRGRAIRWVLLERGQDFAHQGGGLGRRLADLDSGGLEGLLLRLCRTRGAGDDGAGVAHGLALGSGEAGDVADDGLGHVRLDEVGRALLSVATNLADHDDRLRLGVRLERGQGVDVSGADDGVAADADRSREAQVAQFVHHLVRERAGLGNEADRALAGDVRRGDSDERLTRRDDAGAVRPDDAGPVALLLRVGPELGGVADRNALSDDDEQRDLGVNRFDDRVLGEGGRDEGDGNIRPRLLHGFGNGPEDEQGDITVDDLGAGLAGINAADDLGARSKHQGGVLGALAAGDALDDDLRILVEEDRHLLNPLLRCVRELGSLRCAFVHGCGQRHQRVVGFGQDAPAFLDLVAVEANHRSEERRVGKECRSRWSPCH